MSRVKQQPKQQPQPQLPIARITVIPLAAEPDVFEATEGPLGVENNETLVIVKQVQEGLLRTFVYPVATIAAVVIDNVLPQPPEPPLPDPEGEAVEMVEIVEVDV